MNVNLCFHGIGNLIQEREAGERRYWITQDLFTAILDEAKGWPNVRLSFDDGNKSDISVALPALAERGLHATFFPLAGRLDDPQSVSEADLRELRRANMDIGTHGWSHIPWRHLDDEQTRQELVDARKVLSLASDGPIEMAALPLGRYDRHLLRQLVSSGYRTVFTSDRRPAGKRAWLQARYSVTAEDTIETVRTIVSRPLNLAATRNYLVGMVKRIR